MRHLAGNDIGANVGNHTLYVRKFLRAAQAIVFEPSAMTLAILQINVRLNGLQRRVGMSHLGIGLPDVAATGRLDAPVGKLAAGRTAITGAPDGVKLVPGDSVLLQRAVDFIKLDVEGMELQALAGLERTIARWRPRISIEVDDGNVSAFKEWLVRHHYVSERTYRRYRVNENYLVGRWRRLA